MASILVLDDDRALRSVMATPLGKAGSGVIDAEDGRRAPAWIAAAHFELSEIVSECLNRAANRTPAGTPQGQTSVTASRMQREQITTGQPAD
jgi:CheY-like chemotaxis protein